MFDCKDKGEVQRRRSLPQCRHQDGKVTVPHEVFLAKIRALRYAFLDLVISDGVIVARTDSFGAGADPADSIQQDGRRSGRPIQRLP
jgi:isocitrate lyase